MWLQRGLLVIIIVMFKMHSGSAKLAQNITSHCAILGLYGQCVKNIVSRYFNIKNVTQGKIKCEINNST